MVHGRKPRLLCVLSLHSASWSSEKEEDPHQTLDRVSLAAFQVGDAFKPLGMDVSVGFLSLLPEFLTYIAEP